MELTDWFLTESERDNPHTDLPVWCTGSLAEPLVHGRSYFEALADDVEACEAGDYVFFTDWRGDPDQKVRDEGPTMAERRPLGCFIAASMVFIAVSKAFSPAFSSQLYSTVWPFFVYQ